MTTLEEILSRGKEIEQLVMERDAVYPVLLDAVEIVKTFIIDHGLIVYGGTAIDMALRLCGDKIYPDNLFPDLDFYSPTNVEHAYQLADILYQAGHESSRAINALHMKTMKIDLADNHWLADISYQPQELFDKIPTLKFNRMLIVHPNFQRIDLHSALSFPYDGSPKEVIFARWIKDINRFNKLAKYYPVTGGKPVNTILDVPNELHKYVLTGDLAYSIMVGSPPTGISIDIVHFNIRHAAEKLGLVDVVLYEPFSIIPERLEGTLVIDNKRTLITIHSTEDRLLSVNTIGKQRVVNVQYLLKHYMSQYYLSSAKPKAADHYLARYTTLIDRIADAPIGYWLPSITTYGNENVDLSKRILLNRLYVDMGKATPYVIPANYYPSRGKAHPIFNYRESVFFRESGQPVAPELK